MIVFLLIFYGVVTGAVSNKGNRPPYPPRTPPRPFSQVPIHVTHDISKFCQYFCYTSFIMKRLMDTDNLEDKRREDLMRMAGRAPKPEQTLSGYASEDMDLLSLEDEVEENIPSHIFRAIKLVVLDISKTGMSLRESCILRRLDPHKVEAMMQDVPALQQLIEIKKLEFKSKLMRVIANKAIEESDAKYSTYLLEKNFDEFDQSIKRIQAKKAGDTDTLSIAIMEIRRTSGAKAEDDIVSEKAGAGADIKDAEYVEEKKGLSLMG